MKRLEEYETPESDIHSDSAIIRGTHVFYVKLDKSRDLERRLAACREQLRSIMESSSSTRIRHECKETLIHTSNA